MQASMAVMLNQRVRKLALAAVVGVITPLFLSQASLAQSADAIQPLQEFKPQESQNRDPFSGLNGGQNGVFDIIHRAQMGNLKPMNEFNSEQRINLDNAAAEFRSRQLKLIRSRQQTPALTPATTQPGSQPVAQPGVPETPAK